MGMRVILAAIVGGALVFAGGFVSHEMLNWTGRQIKPIQNDTALRESLKSHFPEPGFYMTPNPPKDYATMTAEQKKKAMEELKEPYKQANGVFAIGPNEEFDMMKSLGMQGGVSVVAALLAAIVLSMTRPDIGFIGRWFIVILMGVFTWVNVNASYFIWYHFPQAFVLDELLCRLLEWGVAGFVMAIIVRPREKVPGF